MGGKTAFIIALILLLCTTASATNYYVSPLGNDDNDGLDSTSAWASIDNGDKKGLLLPGDTICVLQGTYSIDTFFNLTSSGTAQSPIVYRKHGTGEASFTNTDTLAVIAMNGNHVELWSVTVSNGAKVGIRIMGDSSLIAECIIHNQAREGVRIRGSYNRILGNICYNNFRGVGAPLGGNNEIYGNTLYGNSEAGIWLDLTSVKNRVFNNISVGNDIGIDAPADNTCGFNDVWGNTTEAYVGGISDSAGGISANPLLVDPGSGDFSLNGSSPCIDAGLDLGYSYLGSAPEMGAIEYSPITGSKTGTAIWQPGTTTIPKANDWDGTAFGTADVTADIGTFRIMQGAEAPERDEKTILGIDGAGDISMLHWNGFVWSNMPFNPLSTVSESFWWGMGVVYESTSGDARIVYNNGTTGTEGLSHGHGNTIMWNLDGTITTPLSGEPKHLRCAANPVSDEIVVVVSNSSSQDYALVWDGAAWGNSVVLESVMGDDRTDVYVAYEQQSHRALVVYGRTATDVFYRIWDGASWSDEDTLAKPADAAGNVRWTTLGADPSSNRIALGVLTNSQDIWLSVWDGSTWESPQTATNSALGTIFPAVAVAFEGLSGEAMAAYGEATSVRYRKWKSGLGWQAENTILDLGDSPNSITLDYAPASDEMMLSVQDGSSNLNFIFWDGTAWGTPNELETNTGEVKNQPFIFLWDIESQGNQPPILAAIGPKSVYEAQNLNFVVSATDAECTPILSTSSLPSGASFVDNGDGTGTFDWTPDYTQSGPYDVTFYATDDSAAVDSEIVTITVNQVNLPPELAAIGPKSVEEGQNLNFGVSASDPDTTTPSLIAEGLPANASFVDNEDGTGVFDFDPDYTQEGDYNITFIADDSDLADSEVVVITVTPAPIVYVDAIPDSSIVVELDSIQFAANGYDAGSTFVADLTDSVLWSTTDPVGSVDTGGLYVAGDQLSPPIYYVKASFQDSMSDSSSVSVISSGILSYLQVEWFNGVKFDDTTLTTDDDTTALWCRGYDSGDSLLGDISVTWSVTGADSIGDVDPLEGTSTTLNLYNPGNGQIVAVYSPAIVDTSGTITCLPGAPAQLVISPDSATVATDSTLHFATATFDADGNDCNPQTVPTWSVLGSIGTIDTNGTFTPTTAGTGYIVAEGAGLADTTKLITVLPGPLDYITITPDTIDVNIGDTVAFTATGYDAYSNPTDAGELTWKVLGRIGSIDSAGKFFAARVGRGKVAVTSSISSITDTSGFLDVEELYLSTIPLGDRVIHPGQKDSPVLAFRIENYYDVSKKIDTVSVHDGSRGPGTPLELLNNADSLSLYLDMDGDSILTPADSLIDRVTYDNSVMTFGFAGIAIAPYQGKTFVVGAHASMYPRDGDSLDIMMFPPVDVHEIDNTDVSGSDSCNSLGYNIIDGHIAEQIQITPVGVNIINPDSTIQNILIADIPRDGYLEDTLNIFSAANGGTASVADIDSVILFKDDGNGTWGGSTEELRIGHMTFTGDRWTKSGMNIPLPQLLNRFYIGVRLNAYPAGGTTVAFYIPKDGLQMTSGNDGPIDAPTLPVDTIFIQKNEALIITNLPISQKELIPGESSGPILGLRLTNSYAIPIGIDSLRFNLMATDPEGATQAQLDSQIDSVQFYLNRDNDIEGLSPEDSLITSANVSDGMCLLDAGGLSASGNGGIVELAVVAWLDANNCKNDNWINIGIADVTDIFLVQPVAIDAIFPLKNDADFIINAFPGANITVTTIKSATYFGGQSNKPLLDFVLPGNGYSADAVKSLRLTNNGTLNDPDAQLLVKLWADLTGDGFTPDDLQVDQLEYDGEFWDLGGLSYPVGTSGQRFIVTVDIGSGQFEAGTVQFALPLEGAEYLSGMTGPDDAVVENPEAQLVFPANRITVISIPAPSRAVFPGSQMNQILTFALYNGYVSQVHTLTALSLANAVTTKSDAAFADYELGQASLYFDSDNDRTLNGDSLVASGYFENGTLQLSGLDIHLPAESLSYFFVVVDVPQEMIDNDSLAVEIIGPSDLIFSEPVNINGDLPISGGGYLIVDGSVEKQYQIIHLTPHTLSPGDSSVVLYAFRPALNGDQSDTLQSLSLRNLETADTSDIESLELWLDVDNDSLWQASDSLLGSFNYIDGTWEIDSIGLTVEASAPVLLVLGNITALATPNASFRGEIPLGGCEYASENDGPVDAPLTGDCIFTISTSSLRIMHSHLNESYSAGQSIEVRITATNLLTVPIDTVLGEVVEINNPALVVLDSSHAGPVSLAAGDSTDFVFYYTASQVGSVSWQVRAVAPTLPDSSPTVQIDTVQIQATPANVTVQLINSIPTAVIRGQPNVFPLSIKCPHPDSSSISAALRLDSIRLSVEDGSGAPLPADEVFSRMVLATGYTNLTILENPPQQSSVLFVFGQPVIVASGQQQILSLLVDIDSLASPDDFALSVGSAAAVTIVDNNTYQPVPLDPGITFPLKTALCRIDDPSRQIVVSDSSLLRETVNYGQTDVDVMQLRLRHPGAASSSQIQLTGLSVTFVDEWSDPIAPSELFDRVRLRRQQTVVAEATNLEADTSDLELILSSPVTLSPGDIDSVVIQVWVKEYSTHSGFSLLIDDSTSFVVRDLSSGSLLQAATDTMFTLATESVFPIASGWAEFKQPAVEPELCIMSGLPSSVVGGIDSLTLFELSVHYPANDDYSSLKLDQILLAVLDTLGQPLNPDRLFDRIGFCLPSQPPQYQPFIRLENGNAVFELGDDALIFNPGDSNTVRLIGDIEADAPFDHFVLVIPTESDISIVDVNDGSHHPGFTMESQCSAEFPFATGATRIFLPAGRPVLTITSLPVQIAHPGQAGVKFLDFDLDYTAETLQGDLALSGLGGAIFKQTAQGTLAMEGSRLFDAVYLLIDIQIIASESNLPGDTLSLTPDSSLIISEGSSINLTLLCDIKETAPVGNYFVGFDDSTFLDISDRNLQTVVYPLLSGGSYPLKTAVISLASATLEKSFTNYPNPFNPSRGEVTTIGFALSEPAYVDIEMFTITGEAVKKIVVNSYRLPGPHQRDVWSSENDQGLDVLPGTYFCRITARYDTGRTESYRRKISVVR